MSQSPGPSAAGQPAASRSTPADEQLAVLVADGNPQHRQALCGLLEQAGLKVTAAAHGREALELARCADVLVVDVELPDRGGLALAAELRAARVTAGVAILERSAADLGPEGTVRALQAGADAYLPESIAPDLLVAAVSSLAQRGRGRRALIGARQRLEAGIDVVPLGVMLLDERLCVVGANRRLLRMGLIAPHPRHTPVREAMPGAAGERVERLARLVLETGREQADRFGAGSDPAARHWQVRAHAVSELEAGIAGVGVTIEDVSELERTLTELRASQARWHAVLGSAQMGVGLRDEHARLIVCNDAYAQIYDQPSPEAMVGTDLNTILTPELAGAAMQRYRDRWLGTIERGLQVDREYVLSSGRKVVIHTTTALVRDDDGAPLYQLTLVENRAEERRLADELARTQRIEAIGRLAGGVAHDVNNMLAVIIGYTEIVSDRLGAGHHLQPELAEIGRAAEHSRSLARELLAFGRRQVLQREPVTPGAAIAGLEGLLRRTIGESIALTVIDESAGAIVLGDRAQLETVVVNLVANARDAMPDGGAVTIRTAAQSPEPGHKPSHRPSHKPGHKPSHKPGQRPGHGLGAERDLVTISVSDTGVGMSEQVREKIFEPFYTTKELGQGTGLGLATVVGVVEQMGGQIAVQSEPGHGSTFVVSLPRASAAGELGGSADVDEQSEGDAPALASRTVLVVEDEPQVLALVTRLLTNAGYLVLSAASGKQALDLLCDRARTIDLLLTDMILPDLSGAELARAALECHPELRIVYTSGYTGESAVREGMPPGDGFLAKPYGGGELRRALEVALDRSED
ncbi:MAG: response regulator [Solirubrobacteraceae bacterium]